MKEKSQAGLDYFRWVSTLMVIAIHTFPFHFLGKFIGDELITLTIFRIAVPFFLLVTGYYVLGPYLKARNYTNVKRIKISLKKWLQVYGLVVLGYAPLIYLTQPEIAKWSFFKIVQEILFGGFMYHLWYFPGLIVGMLLLLWLLKRLPSQSVLIITGVLYVIGTLGETYYFLLKSIFHSTAAIDFILMVFGTTRNGVFFTPLFLLLGALMYGRKIQWLNHFTLFWVLLIVAEGSLVHLYQLEKHDAMYLTLPFISICLFQYLLTINIENKIKKYRHLTLWVYLVHPYWIYIFFVIQKVLSIKIPAFFVFVLVSLLSIVSSVIFDLLIAKFKVRRMRQKKGLQQISLERGVKKIDQTALLANLTQIQSFENVQRVMAIVKANAYGTDAVEVALLLEKAGVTDFGVATLHEGIVLRKGGVRGSILILGYTDASLVKEIQYYDLLQTIVSLEHAKQLLQQTIQPLRVHVKVDTGMHRLGFDADEIEEIISLSKFKQLKIEGIFSHLGSADDDSLIAIERVRAQQERYDWVLEQLAARGLDFGMTHLQSSYAIVNYPDMHYDMVRAGLFLYGYFGDIETKLDTKISLQPIMVLSGQVIQIHELKKGDLVGYGETCQMNEGSKIGIVSLGYADGISRGAAQFIKVKFDGQEYPIVGRICMDMLIVDFTTAENDPTRCYVEILKNIEEISTQLQTISNETLSRLGNRFLTKII
ncbi:alanine racemase [Vagococcus silagei]|uniref:Alanine racemase n=1 Tax=Vagococcus silagei TaxID=2508885 RepID=A0A4S3B5R1_9ENTE|nr:alanine racemase [Vagococcus silagei]THB61210.1 alanine racemase [Vagococcus silagei]